MIRNYSGFQHLVVSSALCVLTCVLTSSSAHASPEASLSRGKDLFGLCISCHGADGHGVKEFGAPAIAGMPDWYLQTQLEHFRDGVRGKHPDDDYGNRMRPMARMLKGDDIRDVAAYVTTLKPATLEATASGGDPEKGKGYYGVCMACHGPTGDGMQAVHAPPLKISSDWYLLRQLGNFKNKMRAANTTADPFGATMAPMAATLPDEQAMRDVISYVQTLK